MVLNYKNWIKFYKNKIRKYVIEKGTISNWLTLKDFDKYNIKKIDIFKDNYNYCLYTKDKKKIYYLDFNDYKNDIVLENYIESLNYYFRLEYRTNAIDL